MWTVIKIVALPALGAVVVAAVDQVLLQILLAEQGGLLLGKTLHTLEAPVLLAHLQQQGAVEQGAWGL
jgi:hypothetical protein